MATSLQERIENGESKVVVILTSNSEFLGERANGKGHLGEILAGKLRGLESLDLALDRFEAVDRSNADGADKVDPECQKNAEPGNEAEEAANSDSESDDEDDKELSVVNAELSNQEKEGSESGSDSDDEEDAEIESLSSDDAELSNEATEVSESESDSEDEEEA